MLQDAEMRAEEIDTQRRGLSLEQLEWMRQRDYLAELEEREPKRLTAGDGHG